MQDDVLLFLFMLHLHLTNPTSINPLQRRRSEKGDRQMDPWPIWKGQGKKKKEQRLLFWALVCASVKSKTRNATERAMYFSVCEHMKMC